MKSIMQTEKQCYITGRTSGLQEHHVFEGKNRKLSEKYGLKVWLIPDGTAKMGGRPKGPGLERSEKLLNVHNASNEGVHCKNGRILNMELKKEAQRMAMKHYGWSTEDFIHIFGRNYL